MTAHDLKLARASARTAGRALPRGSSHPLDRIAESPIARRLVIFTPPASEISALMDRARLDIAGLTTNETVHRVATHNPDAFWAIARRDRFDIAAPKGE